MTLENAKRLYKHYMDLAEGRIKRRTAEGEREYPEEDKKRALANAQQIAKRRPQVLEVVEKSEVIDNVKKPKR